MRVTDVSLRISETTQAMNVSESTERMEKRRTEVNLE